MQLCLYSKLPELVIMVYSPHPLVATERVTLELLHVEATSESFPMIIDELDESCSGIRNEFFKPLLSNLYPLDWVWGPFFLRRVC
jgi:hypothetical protein